MYDYVWWRIERYVIENKCAWLKGEKNNQLKSDL